MNYNWIYTNTPNTTAVSQLSQSINVDHNISSLLIQKGITDFESAKFFFRPELSHLHDPYLMKDMDKAIDRIIIALEKKEKILIYGDYDVDGTTAVALVYTYLRDVAVKVFPNIKDQIDFYIPDRYKEGYGISNAGIDFAEENNFKLIIALDCGIKSIDKIDYANKKGIDFIICDHHTVGAKIPDAIAVLDPKRKDCTYPFKELSGCGIGFKLAQAFNEKYKLDPAFLNDYLDLCAISIAADIVPVVDENRALAYYGLQKINSSPRLGIKAILTSTNVTKTLNISDLVFIIGPRINAAGRIESGKNAVRLLISESEQEARGFCELINKNNLERQGLDKNITQEAFLQLDNDEKIQEKKSTVVYSDNWHKGVVGIVASRLTEKYYRPTIVLTKTNGMYTGSARSVKDYDIYEAIDACSHLLEQYGGHKFAAGLTLKEENVKTFADKFEEYVSGTIQDYMLIPRIEIDLELRFEDISDKFLRILKQFAPFGPLNMAPVFITRGVRDLGYARTMKETHLRMELFQDSRNITIPAVGFGLGHKLNIINSKLPFDVCYSIEENEFNGKSTLQLSIKDICEAGEK